MLVFGHLGLGLRLVRLVRASENAVPVLAGAILPDALDKTLYYGMSFLTGRTGADIGLISCTRTFGHTALFTMAIVLASRFTRAEGENRRRLVGLALGVFTHHLLDLLQDLTFARVPFSEGAETIAFLYPVYRSAFAAMPTHSLGEHLAGFLRTPGLFAVELVGMICLAWDWRQGRR